MLLHFPGGIDVQQRLGFWRALRVRSTTVLTTAATALAAILVPAPLAALPSLNVRPAAQPAAEPALWMLRDVDTTIYLFGTFHALDASSDWFGRNVRAAFDSSDQLILETLVPTDPIDLTNALIRHALVAVPKVGQPVAAGGSVQVSAFAASARQAMAAGRSAGMTVDRGADAVLRSIADSEGKPVSGLESFDFQLAMFTGLPSPAPAPAANAPPVDPKQLMIDLRAAWERGDSAGFAAVLGTLETQSPVAYRRLFVDRNADWASWIARRMGQPGTVFVAVGTGHLIGRDSVQQQLASRGYRTTRIY